MSKWLRALALAAAMTAAAPLTAQPAASDGEQFLVAVKEGNGAKAVALAEAVGSTVVNYRGNDGTTALLMVTRARNNNWVGYLLSRGADPNIAEASTGDTPLIIAARLGYSEGVARLLMRRAQVDKANKLGSTPLIEAVQQRRPAIVKMLLQAGANPDKQDFGSGYSARDYAKRDTRSRELIQLIETIKPAKKPAVGPVAR